LRLPRPRRVEAGVFRGPSLPVFLPSLLLPVASLPSGVVLPLAAASCFVVA